MTKTELNAAIAKVRGWTGSDGLWRPYTPCLVGEMRDNPTDDHRGCWVMLKELLTHQPGPIHIRLSATENWPFQYAVQCEGPIEISCDLEEAVCRVWCRVFGSKE